MGSPWLRRVCLALVVVTLAACGGDPRPPPPKDGDLQVTGTVKLPAGSPLDPASLKVSTPIDLASVAADGSFTVEALQEGASLIAAANASGRAVLLGFADPDDVGTQLSARSTAVALLYVALGAQTVPVGDTGAIVAYLEALPELSGLTSTIETLLAGDPLAVANGSDALVAAVLAARDAVIAREVSTTAGGLVRGTTTTAIVVPGSAPMATGPSGGEVVAALPFSVVGNNGVLIEDAGVKGGFEVLPGGSSYTVAVRNVSRRSGTAYIYQTGHSQSDGSGRVDYDPPVLFGHPHGLRPGSEIDASIGVETGVGFGGGSRMAPTTSLPIVLDAAGSGRTHYVAVIVAATDDLTIDGDLILDPKYGSFIGDWGERFTFNNWLTYWTQLFWPTAKLALVGQASSQSINYVVLANRLPQVKALSEPFMTRLGMSNPLADPATLITDILVAAIMPPSDKAVFDALFEVVIGNTGPVQFTPERLAQLKGNATTVTQGAVLKLITATYSAADFNAVYHDVTSNPSLMAWKPDRLDQATEIYPDPGEVMRLTKVSERFTVLLDRAVEHYQFVFRWTTSGDYGFLETPDDEPFVTKNTEVQYIVNDPVNITEDLVDTVTVEIFMDEDGSGTIPEDAEPVSVVTSSVHGVERVTHYRGKYDIVSQEYTEASGQPRFCMVMYWVFERMPGAKSYDVRAFNFLDPEGRAAQAYPGEFFETNIKETLPLDQTPGLCGATHGTGSVHRVGNEVWVAWDGLWAPEKPDPNDVHGQYNGSILDVAVTY